jgi:hypothetical protein
MKRSHIAIWTRTAGNWTLTCRQGPIARLERAGDGWLCYARDANGTAWFVGVSGRLAAGKSALEQLCYGPRPFCAVLPTTRFIGTEAPM